MKGAEEKEAYVMPEFLESFWRKSCSPSRNETPTAPNTFWCRSNIPFKVMAPCGSGSSSSEQRKGTTMSIAHPHCCECDMLCARAMPCCRILMCPSLWGTHNTYITTALPSLHSFHVLSYRSSVVRSLVCRKFTKCGRDGEGGREGGKEGRLHARPRY